MQFGMIMASDLHLTQISSVDSPVTQLVIVTAQAPFLPTPKLLCCLLIRSII